MIYFCFFYGGLEYTNVLNLHIAKAGKLSFGVSAFGVPFPRKGFLAVVYSMICSFVFSHFRELLLRFECEMALPGSRTLCPQLMGTSVETLAGEALEGTHM